jgi:hypothetical protein
MNGVSHSSHQAVTRKTRPGSGFWHVPDALLSPTNVTEQVVVAAGLASAAEATWPVTDMLADAAPGVASTRAARQTTNRRPAVRWIMVLFPLWAVRTGQYDT